uniref:CSON004720 protein n=1 Tax=Culicoides sonorensis TaxID=179676 RepID=A0A336K9G2_CULSO
MTQVAVQKSDGLDLDAILNELGFSRYQLLNFFLICLPIMFNAYFTLSYIFTAGVPNHSKISTFIIVIFVLKQIN